MAILRPIMIGGIGIGSPLEVQPPIPSSLTREITRIAPRSHDVMKIAGAKAMHDGSIGLVQHNGLFLHSSSPARLI